MKAVVLFFTELVISANPAVNAFIETFDESVLLQRKTQNYDIFFIRLDLRLKSNIRLHTYSFSFQYMLNCCPYVNFVFPDIHFYFRLCLDSVVKKRF